LINIETPPKLIQGGSVPKFNKPKQGQSLSDFKRKEMLVLASLSAEIARAFTAAMKAAATNAKYTGSPYHRPPGSKPGEVAYRTGLSSRCPPSWNNIEATRVLRNAILDGRVSVAWHNGYPRQVWHLEDDVLYEAMLTNSGNGEYHAYPLEDRWQWPKNYP
jgi:hypothetical protein